MIWRSNTTSTTTTFNHFLCSCCCCSSSCSVYFTSTARDCSSALGNRTYKVVVVVVYSLYTFVMSFQSDENDVVHQFVYVYTAPFCCPVNPPIIIIILLLRTRDTSKA